jgi:nitroreductase
MDFLELATLRRSVRRYADKPVERVILDSLAEALRLAPSACNQQPWKIVFADTPELRDGLARAASARVVKLNTFAASAPVIAALVVEPQKPIPAAGAFLKNRKYALLDVGIAAAQFCLRAAELGLGTCMLGWFDERRAKRLLGIPAGKRIGLLITVGYPEPSDAAPKKIRKPLDEIRSYGSYRALQ